MSSFTAFIPMAMQAASTAVSMAQQGQQAKAAARAQADQQNLQSQMLWQQQEQQTKQRRDLLKRQMASARAALAGGGVGFAGGSGAALMAGLARQAEEDIADGYAMTNLRHQASFGGQEEVPGRGLQQGLQLAQQGWQTFQVLRPLLER